MKAHHLLISALAILILSCGHPKLDASKVFRYNQSSGISSLDPAFAKDQANTWAVNQLFNGLVQFDCTLTPVPCIAKRWSISNDGLMYTFYLRNDVRFHDSPIFAIGKGRVVLASDVVYSFQRLLDQGVASPGGWVFRGKIDTLKPFIAVDDTTFQLKLSKPFRPMLSILAMQYCSVVPREVVEHYGKDFRMHPIGTGPFQLKIWEEDNALVMERNPHYFERDSERALPYLEAVRINFIKSRQTEYLKFMGGELDFINSVDASTINELLTKEGGLKASLASKIQLYKRPYLNTEYLGILMDDGKLESNSPLKSKKVRQAINYAINRPEMLKYLRNGIGKAATAGFIPYGLPSYDTVKVKGYQYDLQKARRLLAEAGYANSKDMPLVKLYTSASYEDMANYIEKQLKDAGINMMVQTVPPAFQRELMAKSKAEFFRGSWIADYADAENYLSLFYDANTAPPNYTRFHNAHFNQLYQASLSENDDTKRYALYQQMDSIIIDEAPVVPLYYDEVLRFVSNGVQGMTPNPLNLLELKKVKK